MAIKWFHLHGEMAVKIHKKERFLKEVEEKLDSMYMSDGFGLLCAGTKEEGIAFG